MTPFVAKSTAAALTLVIVIPGVGPEFTFALHGIIVAMALPFARFPQKNMVILIYPIIMASLTMASLAIDENRIGSDYTELAKYVVILLTIVASLSIFHAIDRFDMRWIYISSAIILMYVFIEVVFQHYFRNLILLYTRPNDVFQGKAVAFFYTTYFAASVYGLMSCLFLAKFWTNRKFSWIDIVLSAIFVALIVLTQSRISFFAAITLAILISFAFLIRANYKQTFCVFAFGAVLLVFALSQWSVIEERLAYLVQGLSRYILNFNAYTEGTSSLAKRLSQVTWAFSENNILLIGSGIGKGYMPLLESWISLMYYRYGILGMLAYVILWGAPVIIALSKFKEWTKRSRNNENAWGVVLIGVPAFCLILPIFSISSMITDQPQLLFIFYFFLCAFYSAANVSRKIGDPR